MPVPTHPAHDHLSVVLHLLRLTFRNDTCGQHSNLHCIYTAHRREIFAILRPTDSGSRCSAQAELSFGTCDAQLINGVEQVVLYLKLGHLGFL